MATHQCKVCGVIIHPKRVALGYPDTCVNHSSTERYSGLIIADAKATNSLQIIRDSSTAKHLQHLSRTRGRC